MINAILLIIIALCYIILRLYLKKRFVKTRTLSDEDYLVNLTLKRGMSAYEIFHIAGKPWNQPESKIEENFIYYLKSGDIPHYVRDYVRKNLDSNDLDYDLTLAVFSPGCLSRFHLYRVTREEIQFTSLRII